MLAVGITGGIGSGKSYVCKAFENMGIPVYNADTRAKYISNNSRHVIEQICQLFGSESYINAELNRPYIASKVFNSPSELQKLNAIIHPEVEKDYKQWLQNHNKLPYTLKEAAILFESGAYKHLNKTIVVTAPQDIRVARVTQRDNIIADEVLSRIKNQWPTEKIIPLTDFVIENDGKKLILPQIIEIDQKLKEI